MSNEFGVDIVPSHLGPSFYQDMALRDCLAPYGLLGPQHAQALSRVIFLFGTFRTYWMIRLTDENALSPELALYKNWLLIHFQL